MSDPLKTVPAATPVHSGVEKPAEVAAALAEALAGSYALLLRTQGYHWNVEGALFHAIRSVTGEQLPDLFAATNLLGERIRALGHLAPMGPSDILRDRLAGPPATKPSAQGMIDLLADAHEALAAQFHALERMARQHSDPVTADLATQRSAFHERAAWMLRAIAA